MCPPKKLIPSPCKNCPKRTADCRLSCRQWKIYEAVKERHDSAFKKEIHEASLRYDEFILSSKRLSSAQRRLEDANLVTKYAKHFA